MTDAWEWRSTSPDQTFRLGQVLGGLLQSGELVALCGALGSGKTHFVKGIAAGLGVPPGEPVISPTFVLVREYVGRLRLYHVDAYRLRGPDELIALGLDEMLADAGGVVALEWADRCSGALPEIRWRIDLAHAGRRTRRISLRPPNLSRIQALPGLASFPRTSTDPSARQRRDRRRQNPG